MRAGARKIEAMQSLFGQHTEFCRDCSNFSVQLWRSRKYFKCDAYSHSCSEASDWRASYTACGLFNAELDDDFIPVLERLKRLTRPTDPEPELEGQMDLFGRANDG